MAASRSCTAMATWSISVSREVTGAPFGCRRDLLATSWRESRTLLAGPRSARSCAVPPEERDPVLAHLLAEREVVDAKPLPGSEGQHAELALVEVVVHLVRGLAHLGEGVHSRQDRLDHALADEPVGLPRLLVVGEVGRHDPLQLHPEMAVVVLD